MISPLTLHTVCSSQSAYSESPPIFLGKWDSVIVSVRLAQIQIFLLQLILVSKATIAPRVQP